MLAVPTFAVIRRAKLADGLSSPTRILLAGPAWTMAGLLRALASAVLAHRAGAELPIR